MRQQFDRVMRKDEQGNLVPEKYLYRRKYQNAAGDWSMPLYYALFTDWKGIRGPSFKNLNLIDCQSASCAARC